MPFGWVGSCDQVQSIRRRVSLVPCLQCLSAGWGVVTLKAHLETFAAFYAVSNAFRLGGEL